jgi:hypothetical protein
MNPGEFVYCDDISQPKAWQSIYPKLVIAGCTGDKHAKETMLDLHAVIGTAMKQYQMGMVVRPKEIEARKTKIKKAATALANALAEAGISESVEGAMDHLPETADAMELYRAGQTRLMFHHRPPVGIPHPAVDMALVEFLGALPDLVERNVATPLLDRTAGHTAEFRLVVRTVKQCLLSTKLKASPALVNRIVSTYYPQSDHDLDAVKKMLLHSRRW